MLQVNLKRCHAEFETDNFSHVNMRILMTEINRALFQGPKVLEILTMLLITYLATRF